MPLRGPVGGFIIADNTITRRADYDGLFTFLDDHRNGFTTMTLPMNNGLEVAVRTT